MLCFDAHLDLAMGAVEWNRDLTLELEQVRRGEEGMTDKSDRGRGTVTLGEMRRGQVGMCVATQIAHSVSPVNPVPGWKSPEIAWAHTQGQLAWYRAMEEAGQMRQITDVAGLDDHAALWQSDPAADAPIGYVLSLEGADSLLTLDHLHRAYGYGLRAVGPAHYGPGRYAPGTGETGPLEPCGRELLAEMRSLDMILDVTHLTDEGFDEALGLFDGPVWASHSNCRALVPAQRQLSDPQIKALIERDAVIGLALDAWMLSPGWVRGETTPQATGLTLEDALAHMDHICQLAGSARHCGIGSDLDGGFGNEQTPLDVGSIMELGRVPALLAKRGFPPSDVEAIMHGNWLRLLRSAWG